MCHSFPYHIHINSLYIKLYCKIFDSKHFLYKLFFSKRLKYISYGYTKSNCAQLSPQVVDMLALLLKYIDLISTIKKYGFQNNGSPFETSIILLTWLWLFNVNAWQTYLNVLEMAYLTPPPNLYPQSYAPYIILKMCHTEFQLSDKFR